MTAKLLNCPTQKQLTSFVSGKLNVTDSAEIEQHLADCESCCQLLKMLPDEDTLVSLLRDPESETAGKDSPSPQAARYAPTLPPAGEQMTLPPSNEVTEIGDRTNDDARLSLPQPLREHSRYRVTQLIGRGGMGDVYKAHHRMMNRAVALKVINGQLVNSPAAVQRFHREVQAAAKLSHPNIVSAYDAEQAGDTHFLVMEFVDGVELADVIKERGPLPIGEACDYIRQAAIGLQHAHEQGMVHRDIKPQNLMLTTAGVVKILDFGLANLAEAAAEEVIQQEPGPTREALMDRQLTQIGSMMGTPDYMAPEQASDAHRADIRSDIYSLGCTLYCLLTGNAPFAEGSVVDKVRAHSQSVARPLSELRDDVPAELATVIARMMNKSPDERFQTPIEVAKALEPFVGTPSLAGHARPRTSIVKPLAIVGTLLLGLLIALAGVIVVVTNQGRMVIQSEVGDVQVVVKQNGEEITTIDSKTGTRVKWLSTGDYEVELVGGDNDVTLDKTGFQMTRLGTVIVTARWNNEGSGVIRSFTTDDQMISQDNVEVVDGGWKITAADTQTARLFELPMPAMSPGPFHYRAKLKSEDVKGRAYLEMWVRFPGQGEFFSKGFHNAISGTTGWAEYEVPFLLERGQQPDLVKLNLTIEGGGTVWIKDIEVRGRAIETGNADATVSDEKRLQGKWIALSGYARKKPLTAVELAQLSITFDGERVEFVSHAGPPTPIAATFTINPNRNPKQIDFVAPGKQESMPGIYQLDGDRLKLALIDQDYSRPTNFDPDHRPDHLTAMFERVTVAATLGDEERKVLQVAEAFLSMLDTDKFDQSFKMMSNLAKKSANREDVLRTYQTLRNTVGKHEARTLQRVRLMNEFIGQPPGRYAAVQYRSDFEKHKGLFETVLLNVDDDGQWRPNTYAATVQPLPLPEPKKDPVIEQKKQAALSAAQEWLKLVDAGNYGASWQATAKVNRDGISKEKMIDAYRELFQPLEAIQSRDFKSSEYTTQLPRTPVGEYAVIQFTTQFIKGRVFETVVLTKEADGHWRVSGYFHADAPSVPTPPPSTPPPSTPTPPQSRAGLLTNPPKLPPEGLPLGRNLIVDPSLEETPTGQLPNGWFAWLDDGPDFKCEVVEGGVNGKHCLQISGTGTRGVVFATSIPLDRTKRYGLKGRVRVEGEAGTWAVIKLNYFNNTGWLGVDDRVGVTTSDLDWKLFEKTDIADQYPAATLIVPTCHIEGNGTAWFDDLEVIAYDREKLAEDFDVRHGRNNRMR